MTGCRPVADMHMAIPVRDAVADKAAIADAARAIAEGRLVAFGTETVYGLGGDATNGEAVARIFAAKQRPQFNPLICHFAESDFAFVHGKANEIARRLADRFWPGPATLVLSRREDSPVHDLARSGLDSIALRVPASDLARDFLRACNRPIAAPSANRSGRISPTLAAHVQEEFDSNADTIEMILDCGACESGIESTVIDVRGEVPIILRPGSITAGMIESACGIAPALPENNSGRKILTSPGQMQSHYAPQTPLRINQQTAPRDNDNTIVWIGFGNTPPPPTACLATFNLSPGGDIVEAAANLYDTLRRADSIAGAKLIAVAPIPHKGIGIAINDRLSRAATKE